MLCVSPASAVVTAVSPHSPTTTQHNDPREDEVGGGFEGYREHPEVHGIHFRREDEELRI